MRVSAASPGGTINNGRDARAGESTSALSGTRIGAGRRRSKRGPIGRSFSAAKKTINRIARSQSLAALLVGLCSLMLSVAYSLLVRWPVPMVQDEFSYLLAADTFARGRLSNPSHPLWTHFESMHIIQQPSYASKYPPAQGLVLAVGQLITGYPIAGAWFSTALACAGVCWMLMAWMRPRWALLGGIIAVLHPTVFTWSQTFWGGSVAMLGGALLLGSARRIAKAPTTRDGLLMGVGLTLLANTRPYEGMVLSALVLAALFFSLLTGSRPASGANRTRAVFSCFGVLAFSAGAMALYNLRVTGSVSRMPYMIHETTYGLAPPFLWQSPKPAPNYNHSVLRTFYEAYRRPYTVQRNMGVLELIRFKLISILVEKSVGEVWRIVLVLLVLPCLFAFRRMRALVLGWVAIALALLPETWLQTHYFAPAVPLTLLLEMQAARYLRAWRWRGHQIGRVLLRLAFVSCVLAWVSCASWLAGLEHLNKWRAQIAFRARILAGLERQGGEHLIVVRYAPDHRFDAEWVYNEADIDSSRVVWAREMDSERNRRLLNYFKNRRAWLLEPDLPQPRLTEYPAR
jgi:hypothetical protein